MSGIYLGEINQLLVFTKRQFWSESRSYRIDNCWGFNDYLRVLCKVLVKSASLLSCLLFHSTITKLHRNKDDLNTSFTHRLFWGNVHIFMEFWPLTFNKYWNASKIFMTADLSTLSILGFFSENKQYICHLLQDMIWIYPQG